MGTAYISLCIDVKEGPVTLFQAECEAEVEYTTISGELDDWHIRNLRFEETRGEWDATAGKWSRAVTATAWCPDDLRAVLLRYVDERQLEEDLFEHLRAEGEIPYANEALRADYRSAVL